MQASTATTKSALRSLSDLQNAFQSRLRKMQATTATKKSALRSLEDLQRTFQPSLYKMQATTIAENSVLRPLADLQKDFRQRQRLPSKNQGDASFPLMEVPVLPHLMERTTSVMTDTTPISVMTNVMLAVLHQKLQDKSANALESAQVSHSQTPGPMYATPPQPREVTSSIATESPVCQVYSREMLLSAFRALNNSGCLLRESPGVPSTRHMPQPHKQTMLRRKPLRGKKCLGVAAAENVIGLESLLSNEFSIDQKKNKTFEKASGDSASTAAGDTASDFSEH